MEKTIIITMVTVGVTGALGCKLLQANGEEGKAGMLNTVVTSMFGMAVIGFAAKFIHALGTI